MEIKTVVQTRKKPPLRYFISILLNWSWWHKWVVAGLFFVMLISGISVACVYIGIQFSNTGKATTLKGWMNFVVGDTFSIAQTYARSFWIDAEEISIDISFKNLSKLEQKRREALRRGVLVPLPTDWVPAKIKHRNNIYKVSVKLKGQLHDHWKDPKEWSLKVKVKNGKTIFGMRRFALQAPRTRVYLNEWVHHKILKNFGLIGLRYKFVELTVNGEKRPIYQIEENFDEILIENNKRPEGPLFRLRHARFRIGSEGLSSQFAGGAIIPFQKNRLIKNDKLLKQFIYSKNLFEGFRTGKLKASEVFDLPKLTMVFAINDLFGNHHGISVKNLKFYFNPSTKRIEPVAYDLSDLVPLKIKRRLVGFGARINIRSNGDSPPTEWIKALMSDIEFQKDYINSLEKVSRKEFIDEFIKSIDDKYSDLLSILNKSYPWYKFNWKLMRENQEYIRNVLSPMAPIIAYLGSYDNEARTLRFTATNIHQLAIAIDGISVDGGATASIKPIILQGYNPQLGVDGKEIKIRLPDDLKWSNEQRTGLAIRYRLLGRATTASEAILPWPRLAWSQVATQEGEAPTLIEEREFYTVEKHSRRIVFKPGKWTIDRDVIIPAHVVVEAAGGTTLNLIDGASIISYSPLKFEGDNNNLITIHSHDSTGQGILVLNAKAQSIFSYVRLLNLSAPVSDGWKLTGAVTFYESPIEIFDSGFINNRSPDALNVVRSKFNLRRTIFGENYLNGAGLDFSHGEISELFFGNNGGDAIDINGSVVKAVDIVINQSGGNGIKLGTKGFVFARGTRIKRARVGITIKDGSKGIFKELKVMDAKVGVAVYPATGKFDAASFEGTGLFVDSVQSRYLGAPGSKIIVDGQVIPTQQVNVTKFSKK